MEIDDLIIGYQRFLKNYLSDSNKENLDKLSLSQSPKVLLIRCCDSRLEPTIITKAPMGSFFTFSCIANLVPEYDIGLITTNHPVVPAIYVAIEELNIKNIIVLGHSNCQGCKKIINNDWINSFYIQYFAKFYNHVSNALITKDINNNELDKFEFTEHEAIKFSINNLATYPFIKSKLKDENFKMHGWYFNIKTGELEVLDNKGDFVSVEKFYATEKNLQSN